MVSGLILSEVKPLPAPPSGRVWPTSYTANVGGDRMNLGLRILLLPRANGLLGGRMRGYRSGKILLLRKGNYP